MSRDHLDRTNRWTRRALLGAGVASAGAVTLTRRAGASEPPPDSASSTGGLASADAAVDAYLTAMASADFDRAVESFAIEPYVEHHDLAGYLRWTGFYLADNLPQPLPNTDPFNVAINLAQRRDTVAREITNQYFALANPELDRAPTGSILDGDDAVDEFVADLEAAMTPTRLVGLADHEPVPIPELDADAAETMTDERFVEQSERLLAIVGADEATEVAVRTTIGKRPVALCFRAVRYGSSWWLETLNGQLARLLDISPLSPGVLWLAEPTGASEAPEGPAPSVTTG